MIIFNWQIKKKSLTGAGFSLRPDFTVTFFLVASTERDSTLRKSPNLPEDKARYCLNVLMLFTDGMRPWGLSV